VRDDTGAAIEVEIWKAGERLGGFVDAIPAPLGIGTLTLENGRQVKGFPCEAHATRACAKSPAWEAGGSPSREDERERGAAAA
jgi:hypothetical protein